MLAAAATLCKEGHTFVMEKLPRLSWPKEDSACEMGNVRQSTEQSAYSWIWPDRSYWTAIEPKVDNGNIQQFNRAPRYLV